MIRRSHVISLVVLSSWLCLAPTADAQVTKAVQKLLPSTVAVELRTKSIDITTDVPLKMTIRSINKSLSQQAQTSPESLRAATDAIARDAKKLSDAESAIDSISYATGTIVSEDGLIVTTLGSDVGAVTVTMPDGQELSAKLVASDRRSGLQLLKAEAENLPAVEFSDGDVLLGLQVAAVACSDVDDREAATGIITAKERTAGKLSVELLQTDVEIGPMSAGAPLANLRGEVIGILVAKVNDKNSPSFAVPVAYVRELVELSEKDELVIVQRGFLGVALKDDDEQDAPLISDVINESSAEEAGMTTGDTIVKINGRRVSKLADVLRIIGSHKAGDDVEITAKRDGKKREYDITLGAHPDQRVADAASPEFSMDSIQLSSPGRIIVAGTDGDLLTIDGETGTLRGLTIPNTLGVNPVWNKSNTEALIESYKQAMKAQREIASMIGQPTIRVQRSDVEKQLVELTDRVKSLQDDVQKLTEELQNVGTKTDDQ